MAPVAQGGAMYANAEEEVFEQECKYVLEMKSVSDEARVVTISQEELVWQFDYFTPCTVKKLWKFTLAARQLFKEITWNQRI